MRPFRVLPLLVLPLALTGAACAESPDRLDPAGATELRLGLLAHDPGGRERGSADLSVGLLLALPPALRLPEASGLRLRAEIGGTLNPAGRTSHLHAGLNAQQALGRHFFVEAGLGLALHDGKGRGFVPAHRSAMACAAHFREMLGLGYRIDARWSVLARVEHLSNAGLCRRNRGLTNVGLGLGYRF